MEQPYISDKQTTNGADSLKAQELPSLFESLQRADRELLKQSPLRYASAVLRQKFENLFIFLRCRSFGKQVLVREDSGLCQADWYEIRRGNRKYNPNNVFIVRRNGRWLDWRYMSEDRIISEDELISRLDQIRPGDNVYVRRNNNVVEQGWRVCLVNPDMTIHLEKTDGRDTLEKEVYIFDIWPLAAIENFPSQEALGADAAYALRREKQILEKYSTLPAKDYHEMFSGWGDQENVGICYFVSGLNCLRISPHAEAIIRLSMKLPDGKERIWKVRVPMADNNSRWIPVTPEDLLPQPNPYWRKANPNRDGEIDDRKDLLPLKSSIGYQILEAAFIKYVNNGVMDRSAVEGGSPHQMLEVLLGRNCHGRDTRDVDSVELNEIPEAEQEMIQLLDDFHPSKYMAIACTASENQMGGLNIFRLKDVDVDFLTSHAYSILKVDKFSKLVSVSDPNTPDEVIILTYQQFMKAFNSISLGEIDYSELFKIGFV